MLHSPVEPVPQQHPPTQAEVKAHALPLGRLSVQAPPVQNSRLEHSESSPHGVPGHTPPNTPTSPALHSHVPPAPAQVASREHTPFEAPGRVQQHAALSAQAELNSHCAPIASFGTHAPPVQN